MIAPDEMRRLVRRHIELWKTATHAEWRACFTPDYSIEDPVGTGARPMGTYAEEWDNMHAASLKLDMEVYRLTVGGHEIVADLRGVTHLEEPGMGPDAIDGARHAISYTGIYTVEDDGLLSANRTFADPVSEDLWKAFYPTLPSPGERPPLPRNEAQLKQAIEDHLFFWNVGSYGAWRRRFSNEAIVEDPVGSGVRNLGDGRALWDRAHAENTRVLLGCHRVIVCGMEALAHTVHVSEASDAPPHTSSNTEIFAFDEDGRIVSWRVFRDS